MLHYRMNPEELKNKVEDFNIDLITISDSLNFVHSTMIAVDGGDTNAAPIKSLQLLLEKITVEIESFCREVDRNAAKRTKIKFDVDGNGNEIVVIKKYDRKEEVYAKSCRNG